MAIYIETIATNRYAPEGSGGINLYSTGEEGGSGLTIGQLAIAVSCASAASYETQSVLKMNMMTSGAMILDEASQWMESIANGSANWSKAKSFLTGTLGVPSSTLPDGIDTYKKRMEAVSAMKAKVDALAQSQQQDMIDLQTLVNRRDVAFSTSSNIVRAFGTSARDNAANF
ncbi:MAG: hypothetical protein J6P13_01810 [Kiritimatiellae bacterium]|nr:hypothetical protein [Kiritimatiellia bacterium]